MSFEDRKNITIVNHQEKPSQYECDSEWVNSDSLTQEQRDMLLYLDNNKNLGLGKWIDDADYDDQKEEVLKQVNLYLQETDPAEKNAIENTICKMIKAM